jgi:hypothetical protein
MIDHGGGILICVLQDVASVTHTSYPPSQQMSLLIVVKLWWSKIISHQTVERDRFLLSSAILSKSKVKKKR